MSLLWQALSSFLDTSVITTAIANVYKELNWTSRSVKNLNLHDKTKE